MADAQLELAELRKLAASRHSTVRRRTAHRLAHLRSPQAAQELIRLLDDPHPAVREAAMDGLSKIHTPPCREALAQCVAAARPDAAIAARALARWGHEAVPDLARILKSGPEPARLAALRGLARLRDPSPVPELRRVLRDRSEAVSEAAVRALMQIADAESLDALADHLPASAQPQLLAIVELLRAKHYLPALPAICRQMAHTDVTIARKAGLAALDLTEPHSDVRAILKPLFGMKPYRMVADRRLLRGLLLALEHGRDEVQLGAARWLGQLVRCRPSPGLREAVPVLRRLIGFFSGTPRPDREVMKSVLAEIEAVLPDLSDHPIPAQAPTPNSEHLPIPGHPSRDSP